MEHLPVSSLVIFLPLAGALSLVPLWNKPGPARLAALAWALLALALAGWLFSVISGGALQAHSSGFFFREDHDWIGRFGIRYTLGMDGISCLMALLTAFVTLVAMLVSWRGVRERTVFHYFLLLVMESGIAGGSTRQ
jgi:NADH-quinone oxidoreductase subunit M